MQFSRIVAAGLIAVVGAASTAGAQTLDGAIDMHAHSDPDGTPRKIDAIDLAKLAKSRGMRGIVLKNHYEPTASLAYIVRKEVPGIEVFGGISLDLTVGGVNPAAVEWMSKVKGGYGKVVWMPTFDSEYQVTQSKQNRPFARVSKDGKLLPEVVQVIGIVAKHNMVLETGHNSPAEVLLMVREGKRQGVRNILVTHATNEYPGLTIEQVKEAAQLGAISNSCGPARKARGSRTGSRQFARRDPSGASFRATSASPIILSIPTACWSYIGRSRLRDSRMAKSRGCRRRIPRSCSASRRDAALKNTKGRTFRPGLV
jgi:hypothetical protein